MYFSIAYFSMQKLPKWLDTYAAPCPLQINTFYNFGFLLGMTMIIQIVTGIMLAIHYNSDTSPAITINCE